jgi:hypothetical protein
MIQLIRRFFFDVHRIANVLCDYFPVFVEPQKAHQISVILSPEDRALLANYRRRRPSVKKEGM